MGSEDLTSATGRQKYIYIYIYIYVDTHIYGYILEVNMRIHPPSLFEKKNIRKIHKQMHVIRPAHHRRLHDAILQFILNETFNLFYI